MDGLNEEVGDGIMFAPLMPAEVLGSGTGSLSQIGQETIKSGGGTRASSATTSKKPIRKRHGTEEKDLQQMHRPHRSGTVLTSSTLKV